MIKVTKAVIFSFTTYLLSSISYASSIPPCAISNLTALTGTYGETIDLKWTAPGDDGTGTGNVSGYLVKYSSLGYIGKDDFDAPWVSTWTQSWVAADFGTEENHTVTGLNQGATYWFCIKAYDEQPTYGIWNSSGDVSTVNTNNWNYAEWVEISITLSTDTISAGSVDPGTEFYIATSSIGVENTGNVTEKFILECSISNPANWAVTGSTPSANNEFRMLGVFNSVQPSSGDYDVYLDTITTTPATSSDNRYAGDQYGYNVSTGQSKWLWLNFTPPASEPDEKEEQTITITITVEKQ